MRFTFLLITFIFLFTVSSFAIEMDVPPTGNTLVYCEVDFNITDLTEGKAPAFSAIFKDISLGKTYTFEFSKDMLLSENHTVLANTTYEITFIIDNKYEFVNKDESSILKVAATASGLTLDWVLKEKGSTVQYEIVRNEEGDRLYTEWLEVTKLMQTEKHEEYWSSFASRWEFGVKKYFIKWNICTEEYWNSYFNEGLSNFEKFCWIWLYGNFVNSVNLDNPSSYFKDETAVYDRFIMSPMGFLKTELRKDPEYYESVKTAYEQLIYWQYQYFLENNDFYNFMTGGTYRGKNNILSSSSLLDAVREDEKRQKQELDAIERGFGEMSKDAAKVEEIANEIKSDLDKTSDTSLEYSNSSPPPAEIKLTDTPVVAKKSGVENMLNALKKNKVSFSIAIIAFVTAGIIRFVKGKRNQEDNDFDEEE